ncbi:MAG: hypothetical protein KAR42_14925 [candidate division Zixibacteria bacterium]|nr:hypothetical protein [candidate division Zixibacteria bacterium]
MADIIRHTEWAIDINSSIKSNIVENSIQINPALQKALLHAAGDLQPTTGVTLTNTPQLMFRTHDLDMINAPTAISSVIMTARAYADNGGLGAGYISYTMTDGILIPVSISGAAGAPAELTIMMLPVSSDGDTSPIAVGTTSKALAVHGDTYTIGDIGIGGTIAGISNIDLQFGYAPQSNAGENGKPFPTLAYYDRQQAVITANTNQLSAATEQRLMTAQSTTAVTASFRQLQEGAVPSGTYTATMAKALVEAQNLQGGRPFTLQLMISPVYDGVGDDYLTFS